MKKKNKVRQYRSNQGRSPEKMESTYKAAAFSIVGLVVVFIYILIRKFI